MRFIRLFVVIFLGFAMSAAYFGLLMTIATVTDSYLPSFGLPVFLCMGVLLALALMKVQTQLERYFIQRHVRKHPDSTWRYTT